MTRRPFVNWVALALLIWIAVSVALMAWIAPAVTVLLVWASDAPQGARAIPRAQQENPALLSPSAVRLTSVVPDPEAPRVGVAVGEVTTATPPEREVALLMARIVEAPPEPGYWGASLSTRQVEGLALYVSDDPRFVRAIVPVLACESALGRGAGARYYVGAVSSTADFGLVQAHEPVWGETFDFERLVRDPVYALQAAYRIWQVQGIEAWTCTKQ